MKRQTILTRNAYVRTHSIPKRSLDRVLADLVAEGMEFNGTPVTQEILVNASWELLEEMGTDW